MDNERLHRTRTAMEKAGLDALVCRLPENVLMLSGHWPLFGLTFLLFSQNSKPLVVVPHCNILEAEHELWEADCETFAYGILTAGDPYAEIRRILSNYVNGKNWRSVGFEGNFEVVAPPWNAAEPSIPAAATRELLTDVFGSETITDATALINELRSRKTEAEGEKLRTANEVAAIGLEAFQEQVSVGVTGIDLVSSVEKTIMKNGTGHRGATRVRAFAQVSTGVEETARAYRPMIVSTDRPMKEGDLALLELGVVVDGFWSDRTRVSVAGSPTDEQQRLFEIVKAAQSAAISVAAPGVISGDVDRAARDVIKNGGLSDEEFLHVTGHGLGFRYHEPVPLICPNGKTTLKEGMVHTVEPGVYLPEVGGLRIEENVIITESGAEVMGPSRVGLE